jgi:hypothetical protein
MVIGKVVLTSDPMPEHGLPVWITGYQLLITDFRLLISFCPLANITDKPRN